MGCKPEKTLLEEASLPEYFKERVGEALARQKIPASGHLEFYLVNLLQEFRKTEALFETQGSKMFDKPLALMLADATNGDANTKIRCLKQLGDVSLYTAGFFSDSVRKKTVGIPYYIKMGGSAYANLSAILSRQKLFAELYQELAQRFSSLVGVLSEVASTMQWKNNRDLLRLYERWMATGNSQLETLLNEAGIATHDPQNFIKPQ